MKNTSFIFWNTRWKSASENVKWLINIKAFSIQIINSLYRVLQKERKKVEAFFVMKLQSNYYFDHKLLFVIFIHLLWQQQLITNAF